MAAAITTLDGFKAISVTPLFEDRHVVAPSSGVSYDVSADGRFVLTEAVIDYP